MVSTVDGYVCALVSIVFFGSNFVPVRRVETGDGMFFQFVFCSAIWVSGLGINLLRSSPRFEPFALLGGILWTTGNTMTIPILQWIGLGLGVLLWGSVNMLSGWAIGHFGLLGVKANPKLTHPLLNAFGVVVCLLATSGYCTVKTNPARLEESIRPLLSAADDVAPPNEHPQMSENHTKKHVLGCVAAIFAGLMYGTNFVPPQILIDRGEGSADGLDYVFSHFSGILLASIFYFISYCIYMGSHAKLPIACIVPAFVSGLMWSVAQIFFFVANDTLKWVISFPLITTAPGMVASLWGILLFKEVSGKRNLIRLAAAFCCTIIGVLLIALSK